MYIIYNIFLLIFLIVFSPIIIIALALKPKLRAGFFPKAGFYKKNLCNKPSIWFHAVSVGEVNAVEGIIKKTREIFPEENIILTTVTRTGQEIAHKKLSKTVSRIEYFPYDCLLSVKSAIKSLNPKLVIIAETEIWPNFSKELNNKNIPLIIINGRISPNSYKNYSKIKLFLRKIFDNYTKILMQSDEDAKRIMNIGAKPEKIEVMGNLKFDITGLLTEDEKEKLKADLKIQNNRLLIAGSTHKGEDEIVLNAFKEIKNRFHDIKLLIAPRHPERNESVLKLISASGFNYGQRSKKENFENKDILLLDVMGELGKLYSVAHIAFLGGSFSNTGGHNPLEAAIYGVPVISGNTVFNFREVYKYMADNKAVCIVENEKGFTDSILELLGNSELYKSSSYNAIAIFKSNSGALDFALGKIRDILSPTDNSKGSL